MLFYTCAIDILNPRSGRVTPSFTFGETVVSGSGLGSSGVDMLQLHAHPKAGMSRPC